MERKFNKRKHEGAWNDEPDMVRFEHKGMKCVVLRHAWSGHLCGYVRLRRGSRLYREVGKVMAKREKVEGWKRRMRGAGYDHERLSGVRVHGGLTFCGRLDKNGAKGLWLGFDCAHAWDIVPRYKGMMEKTGGGGGGKYRDMEYVVDQTKLMAEQVKELVWGN